MRQAVIRSGLEALYYTRAHRGLEKLFGGIGAILTLHHVRPRRTDPFQPNQLLEVTPDFLEDVIVSLRDRGFDLVSMDEVYGRLTGGGSGRFAAFTFDDGYRDNLQWAYPILKRYGVPFCIYVPTSFPDGRGELWWLTLEDIVAQTAYLDVAIAGASFELECDTPQRKSEAFAKLYWALRALPSETEMRETIREIARGQGIEPAARCADLCMTWSEISLIAGDPLVTIGAHTVNHLMLRKASEEVVRREMHGSAATIETALGRRPQHFSYPVGDPTSAGPREFAIARELGFKTAVTTRPGMLFPEHREHLTALPRISLNGEFQRLRYVEVLTSGAATALWNRFRRVDAA